MMGVCTVLELLNIEHDLSFLDNQTAVRTK